MKIFCRIHSCRIARLVTVLLVGGAATHLAAQYGPEQAAPEPNEKVMAEHATEFKVLDKDIARLDDLLVQYTDPLHKVTIFGYRNLLRARGDALKAGWDQVKYEELRYDINLQCQRLANWLAPLRTPPPEMRPEGATEFSVTKLNPSPANPNDVKAALEALDREIARLNDRVARQTIGSTARDSELARIKLIKQHRAALAKEFTRAEWASLMVTLKSQ